MLKLSKNTMILRCEVKHYKEINWYCFVLVKKTSKYAYFKRRIEKESVSTTRIKL